MCDDVRLREAVDELEIYADMMAGDFYTAFPDDDGSGLRELTADYAWGDTGQCPIYNKLERVDQHRAVDMCRIPTP